MKKKQNNIIEMHNILVDAHHGIGDVVKMLPFFHGLRKNNPKSRIVALVKSEGHADILRMVDAADVYIVFSPNNNHIKKTMLIMWDLKELYIDVGIIVPIATKVKWLLFYSLIGCKTIIYSKTNICGNDIENNVHLIELLNKKKEKVCPPFINEDKFFYYKKNALIKFNLPNNLIGICVRDDNAARGMVGAASKREVAKSIKMNELMLYARKMINNGYNIVFLGGSDDMPIMDCYELVYKEGGKQINLVGKTSIMESAGIMANCSLVVGGDYGMIHLADAMGIKTLVYYGGTDPDIIGPFSKNTTRVTINVDCQYCLSKRKIKPCKRFKCIEGITGDVLFQYTTKILDINKKVKDTQEWR